MSFTSSLHAVLAGDATLQGLLTAYEGQPAVFTFRPAPNNAGRPYLITDGALADEPFDTKTSQLRQVSQDIEAWIDASGDRAVLEQITKRIRELLHRQDWLVDGTAVITSQVSGPIRLPGGIDVYGESLTVQAIHEA